MGIQITMQESSRVKTLLCPKCNTDISDVVCDYLEELTGIQKEYFQNGAGIREMQIRMQVAEITLTKAGIEIDQSTIAEKTLEYVEKILSTKLSEEERERFEKRVQEQEEARKQLENELKTTRERVKELETKIEQVPIFKGTEQETSLVKQLESVSRNTEDEFHIENESTLGEDILCKVVDQGTIVEELLIESKNVQRWKSDYVEQLKGDLRKRNLSFGILSTTAMPAQALNKHLYITKEGIWIASREATAIVYRARREFIVLLHRKELSQKEIQEALKLFRDKILSEEYSGRFTKIIEAAQTVEKTADSIQKSVQRDCTTLRKQAEIIRSRIGELNEIHEEILKQVKEE